jgi:hypothetical protein
MPCAFAGFNLESKMRIKVSYTTTLFYEQDLEVTEEQYREIIQFGEIPDWLDIFAVEDIGMETCVNLVETL